MKWRAPVRQPQLTVRFDFGIHPVEAHMINFEEEIAKYSPSLEITQAEEALLSREIIDVADIIEKILQDKKDV